MAIAHTPAILDKNAVRSSCAPSPFFKNEPKVSFKKSGDTFEKTARIEAEPENEVITASIRSKADKLLAMFNLQSRGSFSQDLDLFYKYAVTDPLAKTMNKRALFSDLGKLKANLPENNTPLSVAMFDMDNFKAVNDLISYKTGDEFITVVGTTLQKIANEAGYNVYRFGGEEFIILFPGLNEKAATKIADKARQELNNNVRLGSYVDTLHNNAAEEIAKLKEEQAPYQKLKEQSDKIDYLEELIEKKIVSRSDDNPSGAGFLRQQVSILTEEFTSGFKDIVKKLLEDKAVHLPDKKMLRELGPINAENAKQLFADSRLEGLLELRYNNLAKIMQIEKWSSSLAQMGNFTVTCGVKEFSPSELNKITIEDIVDETGDVLKEGKKTSKGEIYCASKIGETV